MKLLFRSSNKIYEKEQKTQFKALKIVLEKFVVVGRAWDEEEGKKL
jgi:hypothetical protein